MRFFLCCLLAVTSSWTSAATLKAVLRPQTTYRAEIDFKEKATVEQVQVQAQPGYTFSAQQLKTLQSKYVALARDAFVGLNGAYHLTLQGKTEVQQGQVVLPMKATLTTPTYLLDLSLVIQPNTEGYFYHQVSPVNSLNWLGQGTPPLAQIREESRAHLWNALALANAPFGYENSGKQTMQDGFRPLALGLAGVAQGDLKASTTLSWPTPSTYLTQTLAATGQTIDIQGMKAKVLLAGANNTGRPLQNWPGELGATSLIRFQMPYPNQDHLDVLMTVSVQTEMQQVWTVQP